MSDVPRLAPRSAVAATDFELLRVARTDLGEPERPVPMTLADRIRGLAAFRVVRPEDELPSGVVRLGRRED